MKLIEEVGDILDQVIVIPVRSSRAVTRSGQIRPNKRGVARVISARRSGTYVGSNVLDVGADRSAS